MITALTCTPCIVGDHDLCQGEIRLGNDDVEYCDCWDCFEGDVRWDDQW